MTSKLTRERMMGLQIDEEPNHGILKCKRVHIMARSEKHSGTKDDSRQRKTVASSVRMSSTMTT
jgi:hypothetical protein